MSKDEKPIILYHYPQSPYAKRVVWYLQLRGIPFIQCRQPPILPRPDLARLGIHYRRIPVLSIGRDVYLDTRLILRKLEQLPGAGPGLGATEGTEQRAIERLLESLVVDGGVFASAANLLPPNLPMLKDPKFQADRIDFRGVKLSRDEMVARRAESLNQIKKTFELLETTLLADGREWILKTKAPTLADIEAVWPLHWLIGLPGALPKEQVSEKHFPKVYAWIARFQKAVSAAADAQGKARTVSGEEAEQIIKGADYNDVEIQVDETEPVAQLHGFKPGTHVVVWPVDTGSAHKDTGKLVGLDAYDVTIETEAGSAADGRAVRVHAPRHGFRVRPAAKAASNL